jgi:iron complex outermembrane receptor protein
MSFADATRRRALVSLFILVMTLATGDVAGAENPPTDAENNEQAESKTVETAKAYDEQIEVLAERPELGIENLDLEVLDSGRATNLGVAVGTIAGVSGVQRSQNSYEPVVHGLGWERVQTQVNGMPLYGACPARMDPPAFVVTPSSAQEVAVVKGLASVTLGPAGTGGRVDVSTDYDRGAGAGKALDPWLRMAYDSANDGLRGSAGVNGGTERIDYALGIEALEQSDYESADGITVPAGQKDTGAFFSFGHRPTDTQRWSVGAIRQKGEEIAYPSLPMDTDESENRIYSAGYRYRPKNDRKGLSSLEVSLGASQIDHLMSNRERTNRMMMQAETRSDAATYSAGFATNWAVTSNSIVKAGFDLNAMNRDALRQRHITANGRTFYDHLWPDVSQDDIGVFAEYGHVSGTGWHLRFGVRYDGVSSEAAAADDPALGGGTVREAYVRFYGPEAAVTNRDERLLTGNLLASQKLGETVTLQAGLGYVSRAAGMTERYFAFALSPSGYLVGNPTLDAEKKQELSLGATFGGPVWNGSVTGYYYSIADYILPVILDQRDINGDSELDLIRGFENTDATLTGIDFSLLYRPSERWNVPVSLFYVRGEDDTRNVPLPEIPPLEVRLAGRWSYPGRVAGWLELGGRFVAEATRIDPAFPENETPRFTVWHFRGRFDVARYLAIEAGVENLFNEEYWEHLTREAAGNVPGLLPGQEIPQPGRFFTLAMLFDF